MRTARARRWARVAFSLAVVGALVLFARDLRWGAVASAARRADRALLGLAALVNLVSLLLKGVRWWLFLRPVGAKSLPLALRATVAGAALNSVVAAQGGEGARVVFVSRGAGVPSARVLAALAIERLLDGLTYLLVLVCAVWWLPLPREIVRWRGAAALALAALTTALVALALRRPRASQEDAPAAPGLRGYLRRFAGGAAALATARRLVAGLALSIAAWLLQIATYHLVARAAALPLPLAGSVAALITVGLSFLVRATPGNVGVFQIAYALVARSFGVDRDAAVAVALLLQALQAVPVLVAGLAVMPRLARRKDPTLTP